MGSNATYSLAYICFQVLAGFIGTISFAIIFEAPKKHYLTCGIIGAMGWLVYLVYMKFFKDAIGASFASALVLTYLSRDAAFRFKAPVTIFLITGIFCIVPGIGIYRFTYNFYIGATAQAAALGIHVLKICIAISMGIVLGYELSPIFFQSYKGKRKKDSK